MIRNWVIIALFIVLLSACTSGEVPLVVSTVDTTLFNGRYLLAEAASFTTLLNEIDGTEDHERRIALEELLSFEISRYSEFSIENGVIRSGTSIIQEFSLISGKIEENILKGKAIWHEDIQDPGDMVEVFVELLIEDDILNFTYCESNAEPVDAIVLIRDFLDN